ncbi:hydrogenase formation protein HypD [Marinobacter sp.]|uniref:hydrogenase formation protein HypD n=1 Tax=Marinobacter sp. TaxID=50741 RepID=UPI00384B0EB9
MTPEARHWLDLIQGLALPHSVRVMNVCGGHERAISLAGLRTVLPPEIALIPGPGCPVCICPEEDIYRAMRLALDEHVLLVAFGDMLRVPVNLPRTEPRSLDAARAAGADVLPIASPMDALVLARQHPEREVVFFAAGFETTMAPVAAMVAQGLPDNLSLLLSGRLTWPAVAMLLESENPCFDALIAPGHVATIMGPEEWQFVPHRHALPAAVAGFTPESLLAAIYSTLRQTLEKRSFLDNCYGEVAQPGGNTTAQRILKDVFDVVDANWRGIGVIPCSGFNLRETHVAHDARHRFPDQPNASRRRMGQMPAGCACAQVVMGKISPNQCPLYGRGCTPKNPVGPCMVSDEGACRIWWASGVRDREATPV